MGENTISDVELENFRIKGLNHIEGEVTPAELLNLNTSAKTLVYAPGPGKVLELIAAVLILDFESVAYDTNGDLTIRNETGTALSNTVLLANLLGSTADKIVQLMGLDSADTGIVLAENEAIQLTCAAGDPSNGDSPLRYKIMYRVHETGL